MHQPQLAGRVVDLAQEGVLGQPEGQGEAPEQAAAELEHGVVVGLDGLAETGQVRPLVGPEHGPAQVRVGRFEAEVVGFLVVHRGRGELLLPFRHVAAVVAGAADVVTQLVLQRLGEELGGGALEALDQRRVDAVAGDVEEPRLARRLAERVGRGLALLGNG